MSVRARFINALKKHAFPSVFNPYTDRCSSWDLHAAPQIRERNLMAVMEAMEGRVESIWLGRDLGYLGGRRTGLALTDEAHLEEMKRVYGAQGLERATEGALAAERTASVTWQVLAQLDNPPFLWNIFPFHPYSGQNQQSNRCHTRQERQTSFNVLGLLLEWAPTADLIAIGNDAGRGLHELGLKHVVVRHPSYGGKSDFLAGMSSYYGRNFLKPVCSPQHCLI